MFDICCEFSGFKWYKLTAGIKIPPGLALTKDAEKPNEANHYTIAPLNDMPLELFIATLKVLNDQLVPA
jgi:hypothetical protein